ncbi:hypothetical protein ACIF6K_01875 [Streptomyces sp. NPDC085942]|uniref:hypothetical protein n=1 Tax=unclassified Streptomyces TaxID=2593676 RepID=UPI0037CED015|nr:hypothetical protein OG543_27845 [Streptomyces sp. NBC_01178]
MGRKAVRDVFGPGPGARLRTRLSGAAAKKTRFCHEMHVLGVRTRRPGRAAPLWARELPTLHVDRLLGRTALFPDRVRGRPEGLVGPAPEWAGRPSTEAPAPR